MKKATTKNTCIKTPVSPTETLEIENGLSLIPRVKLLLTVYRSDLSVKPIDEWHFKRSLIDYLKNSLSISHHIVPEEDLEVHRFKDLKKRKREDSVAYGVLHIRDLGFINRNNFNKPRIKEGEDKEEEEDVKSLEKKFLEWRESFVKKLDGIELSLQGAKFKLNAKLPESDDFQGLKKSWEEYYAFNRNGGKQKPDTIVLRGLPSRWFAETRVSSKPSILVTHTIFSVFGEIKKVNVASDDDLGKSAEEDVASGLQCKVVVRFKKHDDFYNALKVLCGRSMQKQGSRLRADYEATWDKNDLLGTEEEDIPERNRLMSTRQYESETPRFRSHNGRFDYNGESQSKRFKD